MQLVTFFVLLWIIVVWADAFFSTPSEEDSEKENRSAVTWEELLFGDHWDEGGS